MSEFGLGVWSHNLKDFGSADEMKERVARLAEAGFDLLIPCVKNPPGAVDFCTDAANVNPDYPDWDPLRVLIDTCAEHGISVHTWFCVFPEGDGSRLLGEHPEYAATVEGRMRWACGCRPEVHEYVQALYRSVARGYRPAGLHLDYMRTGAPCTCEFCREQMGAEGVDIEEAKAGTRDYEAWVKWRVGRITEFVRGMRALTQEEGLELSAAVFSGYPECIQPQAQDWVRWAEEELVDVLMPMNYTQATRIAVMRTKAHMAQVAGKVPVWEGICRRAGNFSNLNPDELRDQMESVLAEGPQGLVIFSYGSLTPEDLAVCKELKGA
jgi:uncharacterized lipoprotein YddW (UPF0748 family)